MHDYVFNKKRTLVFVGDHKLIVKFVSKYPCAGDKKVLMSLSDTRWEACAVAIEAILMSYPQIIEVFVYLQEDHSQKGDTRSQPENTANKMQELDFPFIRIVWGKLLQQFHIVCQALQNEYVNFKLCRFVFLISRLLACAYEWVQKIWRSSKRNNTGRG